MIYHTKIFNLKDKLLIHKKKPPIRMRGFFINLSTKTTYSFYTAHQLQTTPK